MAYTLDVLDTSEKHNKQRKAPKHRHTYTRTMVEKHMIHIEAKRAAIPHDATIKRTAISAKRQKHTHTMVKKPMKHKKAKQAARAPSLSLSVWSCTITVVVGPCAVDDPIEGAPYGAAGYCCPLAGPEPAGDGFWYWYCGAFMFGYEL